MREWVEGGVVVRPTANVVIGGDQHWIADGRMVHLRLGWCGSTWLHVGMTWRSFYSGADLGRVMGRGTLFDGLEQAAGAWGSSGCGESSSLRALLGPCAQTMVGTCIVPEGTRMC